MMKDNLTIEDLRRDHPNVLTAELIGQFLKKDPQHVRNLARIGMFPFALVEKKKHRCNYIFPTERFIAWVEGRL